MKKSENAKMLIALGACLIGVIVLFVAMTIGIRPSADVPEPDNTNASDESNNSVNEETNMETIVITIGDKKFTLQLANTDAAKEFAAATPFVLEMSDLNGNEKYYYGEPLPTADYDVAKIHTGDLMLYDGNCIVLFYKDFDTTYRYTKLGKIIDTNGLAEALCSGKVNVIFTKQ